MELLRAFDQSTFLFLNHLPHTPFLDQLAMIISGVGNAGIIWIVLALILFIREEKRAHIFFLQSFGIFLVTWFGVDHVLKNLFARPRPSLGIGAIIVGGSISSYSFPSSHAAISWAAVVLLSRYEPRWKPYLIILAILVSFSRIYLGVHYPVDVFVGGLVGWSIGILTLSLTEKFGKRDQRSVPSGHKR